eukprot:scaffold65239_cov19-Tisochrysis_lutea.AAC.1
MCNGCSGKKGRCGVNREYSGRARCHGCRPHVRGVLCLSFVNMMELLMNACFYMSTPLTSPCLPFYWLATDEPCTCSRDVQLGWHWCLLNGTMKSSGLVRWKEAIPSARARWAGSVPASCMPPLLGAVPGAALVKDIQSRGPVFLCLYLCPGPRTTRGERQGLLSHLSPLKTLWS